MEPEIWQGLRETYRPQQIKTLFVAESPSTGQRFFYLGNSQLFRFTYQAFVRVFGNKVGQTPQEFFLWFQKQGFFLDNLSCESIGYLKESERQQARIRWIPSLADRLAQYRPGSIIVVMKSLEHHVTQAILYAGIAPYVLVLPFPTRTYHNQQVYVDGLSQFLATRKV
ncbi:hypothetical protein [Sulfobacillus thermosulfidooxidans]|uniref:hypothetical protein n=1 Tax=Sulfobacillus thermosulfidooxidans TaxID=28034 RepID=UPI0002D9909C|nr:hypothetical protein [Sulfobacillus thermosulfidooxidans]